MILYPLKIIQILLEIRKELKSNIAALLETLNDQRDKQENEEISEEDKETKQLIEKHCNKVEALIDKLCATKIEEETESQYASRDRQSKLSEKLIENIIIHEKDLPITDESSTIHQLLKFFGDANATNLPNNLSCIWLYEHIRHDMADIVKNIRKICKISHEYLTEYFDSDLSKSLLFLKYTKLARTSCIFYGLSARILQLNNDKRLNHKKTLKDNPAPLFSLPSIDQRLDTFTHPYHMLISGETWFPKLIDLCYFPTLVEGNHEEISAEIIYGIEQYLTTKTADIQNSPRPDRLIKTYALLQHELSRAIVPRQPNAEHPLMDDQVELIPDSKDFNQEHYFATQLFFSGTDANQEPNLNNLPEYLKDQLSKERKNCKEAYDRDLEHIQRKSEESTIDTIRARIKNSFTPQFNALATEHQRKIEEIKADHTKTLESINEEYLTFTANNRSEHDAQKKEIQDSLTESKAESYFQERQQKWYDSRYAAIEASYELEQAKINEACNQKRKALATQKEQKESSINDHYRIKEEHLKEQQEEQVSLLETHLDQERELIEKNQKKDDDLFKEIGKLINMTENTALFQFKMTHNICSITRTIYDMMEHIKSETYSELNTKTHLKDQFRRLWDRLLATYRLAAAHCKTDVKKLDVLDQDITRNNEQDRQCTEADDEWGLPKAWLDQFHKLIKALSATSTDNHLDLKKAIDSTYIQMSEKQQSFCIHTLRLLIEQTQKQEVETTPLHDKVRSYIRNMAKRVELPDISESIAKLNGLIWIEKEARDQEEKTKKLCQDIDDKYHQDKHRKSRIHDTPLASKIMIAVEKLTVEAAEAVEAENKQASQANKSNPSTKLNALNTEIVSKILSKDTNTKSEFKTADIYNTEAYFIVNGVSYNKPDTRKKLQEYTSRLRYFYKGELIDLKKNPYNILFFREDRDIEHFQNSERFKNDKAPSSFRYIPLQDCVPFPDKEALLKKHKSLSEYYEKYVNEADINKKVQDNPEFFWMVKAAPHLLDQTYSALEQSTDNVERLYRFTKLQLVIVLFDEINNILDKGDPINDENMKVFYHLAAQASRFNQDFKRPSRIRYDIFDKQSRRSELFKILYQPDEKHTLPNKGREIVRIANDRLKANRIDVIEAAQEIITHERCGVAHKALTNLLGKQKSIDEFWKKLEHFFELCLETPSSDNWQKCFTQFRSLKIDDFYNELCNINTEVEDIEDKLGTIELITKLVELNDYVDTIQHISEKQFPKIFSTAILQLAQKPEKIKLTYTRNKAHKIEVQITESISKNSQIHKHNEGIGIDSNRQLPDDPKADIKQFVHDLPHRATVYIDNSKEEFRKCCTALLNALNNSKEEKEIDICFKDLLEPDDYKEIIDHKPMHTTLMYRNDSLKPLLHCEQHMAAYRDYAPEHATATAPDKDMSLYWLYQCRSLTDLFCFIITGHIDPIYDITKNGKRHVAIEVQDHDEAQAVELSKLLGESAYQSTQMKSLIPATLNIEKQIGPITQSTFHDSFEINEKHSSSDILFLPHLGASNGEYPFSIIPLSVLRDQPVPAKETDTPAPRNRKSDALVRTYKIDRQIDPYTKEEIPRHHLVTMGLKPKRDAIIPYDDQSTAGDSIDQVARIIEDGIDDQWHLRNIEHLDVEVQSKIQDIKRLIEEMPYAKAPNRKQAISRVRRLMREINESDKEDGRFSNINLLYAFHQAKELDEDVQLSIFSKQHGVLNQLRDNKEKSQEKVSLYAAIHKLNGWGESTSAIDAVTSLAYLATAATDKKIQQRAATLIIHAYLYEDIHYINSYGEKHLRFNPELYEQESQSYHENVRNKEIDANDHINGIIDLSDPQRELEKLYEAGDAYAGILLVQLCLSNRFAHHRKVDAYDNDINKACKILIQCTNKEQPKNPLAQLLYGVCLKYGIGFTKSPYRGKDYIAKVNGDDCITESLIHTDLLAFQLGRFSYEFMIKGYAYQLCNRKPIHQEIAESIEKRKALTDLQIRGGSITRISFNTTARNAILQMGILFNIPGVLEECNQKKPSIKPGGQKLNGKESADDKSIIERIQLAIKNGFDVLYECNEPFYILVKHGPFRDHFIEKVAGSTNTSLRGSLKIR